MATAQRRLEHRGREYILVILAEQAQLPGYLPPGQSMNVRAVQQHLATFHRAQTGEAVQQGGLAAAVATEDAPALAWPDLQIEVPHQLARADAQGKPTGGKAVRVHGRALPRCSR